MCCSIGHPGEVKAEFSGTKVFVGEAERQGCYVHVIAYQNKARSNQPNALILPFPTDKEMTEDNVISTKGFPKFLDDMAEATRISENLTSRSFNSDLFDSRVDGFSLREALVFSSGSYSIILAEHTLQIPSALKKIPEERRPFVSTEFLNGYAELYPRMPIAVCCWEGSIEPEPLLWWYEPIDREKLFVPTMDAHDGNAPNVDAFVKTDHIILTGSCINPLGNRVHFSDAEEDIHPLIPRSCAGHRLSEVMKNGDCIISLKDPQKPSIQRGDVSLRMEGWRR